MKYISTRGQAPDLGFRDTLLSGLARDGGLYIPEIWPELSADQIRSFAGKPYAEIAKRVLAPFVEGEIEKTAFEAMVDKAYGAFSHPATVPLVQIDHNHYVMELFHGPTLAFKDVAMQLLARLMDHVLAERNQKATIVGATSGDTGGAAVEAFRGRDNTDIFILFPKGKVSPVQQRQMTTVLDSNVHALAIEGDFDDCQRIVKEMFGNLAFRDRLQLSGVNSINWGRIMAQIVYYFSTAVSLGAPDRSISFTVPTGNFGDIFAGYVAKRMGLPIHDLVIATNQNDILARTLKTARYETVGTVPSISPSMDIQVSSNFERLLFDASERDGDKIRSQMNSLKQSGSFEVDAETMGRISAEFNAGACNEMETSEKITQTLKECSYLVDPHTAVGLHVAQAHLSDTVPMVTLATAHPAKFPDPVKSATGIRPDLPARMGNMMEREERFFILSNQTNDVETYIEKHSRAVL